MKTRNMRQRILDAAQRLIEEGGLFRLTTKNIARAAGCAEGTLFKYFKRKEDLCLAVVLENSPKFREDLARIQPGRANVRTNLIDIGLAAIRFFNKLIPLAVSLFADADLLIQHRKSMRKGGRGPKDVFDLIARYIRGEQEAGRVNARVPPQSATALLLGACFQRVFIRQAMGEDLFPARDDDFISSLVDALGTGLKPLDRK